jgi:SAM-dependent methyltransferase
MSDRQPGEKNGERLVEAVRDRYGRIAEGKASGCCGEPSPADEISRGVGYADDELAAVPDEANLGLGCGAPLAHLDLAPGETVLDLGSGGGLDALLAARQVGPAGRVIGIDMTPSMLERARKAAAQAGLTHVEFRQGRLEELPVEDASVDAVTSNCVINLVPDKGAVFAEVARVLRPGGRLVISDIVLDGRLPEAVEQDVLAYVGCVSGAMQRTEYFDLIAAAGFGEVSTLKDVDFLSGLGGCTPDDVDDLARRHSLQAAELAGKVRSVTYRAVKAR